MKSNYTWSKHKYIRKEGNKYIYPEDLKANTSKRTTASKATSNSSPGVYVKTASNTSTSNSKLKSIFNSVKNTASNVTNAVKKTVSNAASTTSNAITKAVNHNKAVKAAGGKDAYNAKQVEAKLKASTQQQQRERARQEAAKKKQEEGRISNEKYNEQLRLKKLQEDKKAFIDEKRRNNKVSETDSSIKNEKKTMVENHSTLLTNIDKIDTALYSGSTVEMQRNAVKDSYYRMKHGYKEEYSKIENSIKKYESTGNQEFASNSADMLVNYLDTVTKDLLHVFNAASSEAISKESIDIGEYYKKYSNGNDSFKKELCDILDYYSDVNKCATQIGSLVSLINSRCPLSQESADKINEKIRVLTSAMDSTILLLNKDIKHGEKMKKGNYIMHRSDSGGVGGTGKHRYVAKIGNRYIYPEDLKNGARIVGNKIVGGAKTGASNASNWVKNTTSNVSNWAKNAKDDAKVTGSSLAYAAKKVTNNVKTGNVKGLSNVVQNFKGAYNNAKNAGGEKGIEERRRQAKYDTKMSITGRRSGSKDDANILKGDMNYPHTSDMQKPIDMDYANSYLARRGAELESNRASAKSKKEEARKNNKNSKLTGVNGMTNFEDGQSTKKTESSRPHSRDKKTTSANATMKRGKKVDTKRRKVGIK